MRRRRTYLVVTAEGRIVTIRHLIRNARRDARGVAGWKIYRLDKTAEAIAFRTWHASGGTIRFRAREAS